jgi:predicted translin family RNA/ssDNA-binding protein
MLRLPSSQLVVAVNWGGKVNSLKILNYQNGKIMELLEEGDQDYSISALVKPQFRDGVNPSEEPYEILLMRGVGLPSPDEKQVSVYRYAGGYYEFKGEFSQKLLDNYMEQLLRKKAR